ncbi:hypothetical protein HHK36_029634 [Tetracentron sinense]|uniref:BHLH domain-containing protein n=1 Tax=Tetracentron sinense TaxID=13715 RepID=A0A835CZX3_TETSI|nr:hypothetical protein HHK36_029634 [Tetracentron sinense]
MRKSSSNSFKLDRKIVEKNRRMVMKGLCFQLASLIPNHYFNSSEINSLISLRTGRLSIEDQLDHTAIYIKQLRERIDELKRRKELAMSVKRTNDNFWDMTIGFRVPILELRDLGSTIELILISGKNKNFMFNEVISVLEEEGATVVNASFSIVGDRILHTIHSQVTSSRVGVEISRVCERLKELIYSNFQDPSITRS